MEFILIILAYLLGSIPAGLVVGKTFYKKDIREFGSGNLGATNSFRVLGVRAGSAVMAFDMGKGTVAALVPQLLGFNIGISIACGIAAMIGHSFPVFAGFKGGKSVATSGGVLLALAPFMFITTIVAFLITLKISKFVSLSSVVAGVYLMSIALIWYFFFSGTLSVTLIICAVAFFLAFKHRSNFKRIKNGTEPKVKFM